MPVPSSQHVVLPANHGLAVGALGGLHGTPAVRYHIVVAIGALVPVSSRQADGVYDEFELVVHTKLEGQILSKAGQLQLFLICNRVEFQSDREDLLDL